MQIMLMRLMSKIEYISSCQKEQNSLGWVN